MTWCFSSSGPTREWNNNVHPVIGNYNLFWRTIAWYWNATKRCIYNQNDLTGFCISYVDDIKCFHWFSPVGWLLKTQCQNISLNNNKKNTLLWSLNENKHETKFGGSCVSLVLRYENRRLNKQASEMSEMRIKRWKSGERSFGIKSERTRPRVRTDGCWAWDRWPVCRLFSPSDLHQGSDATGRRGRGAAPQGGRGEGEREGAPASAAPLAPFQPPVYQHEKQVLQRAHASAKWAHMHTMHTHTFTIHHT